jgi:hypothetical protein
MVDDINAVAKVSTTETSSSSTSKKAGKKKKNICFVISPFGGWNDRYYSEIYMPAVRDAGLEPRRADDLYRPSAIVHDIWNYVKNSRVMLADLTGKNPNVFYGLGLAHATGKPVVLLTQEIDDVPFDLRALRVIEYEVEDPDWSTVLRVKIKKALGEVLDSPGISVLPTFLHTDKLKGTSKGAPLERQVLDLQRQVGLISAQSRSLLTHRRIPNREITGPDEARDLMRRYVEMGMLNDSIIRRLSDRGVPPEWANDQLRKLLTQRKRKRKRRPKKK